MFQVIEKGDERKAVHSRSDLEYMIRKGWRKIETFPAASSPDELAEPHKVKRKYTRRAAR